MQETFNALEFTDAALTLLDQRVLPTRLEYIVCRDYREVEFAIRDMIVRGAPAIGATPAYGYYLAACEFSAAADRSAFMTRLKEASLFLEQSRPTAVNLRWALRRMQTVADAAVKQPMDELLSQLKREADAVKQEDIDTNRAISRIGNDIVPDHATILTHCNTGALATAGWGTALGVIKEAVRSGKEIFVYADETRPRLQGARLTAWELMQAEIPSKLISDSAAATLIRDGKIDCVILGGDRVAANGDVCNKIGTFMLSVVCKAYGVPFYSVVPVTTIDFEIETGDDIPIEERDAQEVTHVEGVRIAPEGMAVYNPAFDVTPHQNITGIITEAGIIRPPFKEHIQKIRKAYGI
ncbi:MAG: S-methyl-5-thioribose-1-phosphate isomerase [Spirochaetia bacterium]|nr:S-methyl-5-thioribose-1-phosphate isomerase [Spirochaetia bacterium]